MTEGFWVNEIYESPDWNPQWVLIRLHTNKSILDIMNKWSRISWTTEILKAALEARK